MKRKPDYPETDNKSESREQLRAQLIKTEDEIKDIVGYEPFDFYFFQYPVQETMDKIDELLLTRSSILDKLFAYNGKEIKRIETVNNLLRQLTEQMYRRTTKLYRTILAVGRDNDFDDWYEAEGTLDVDTDYEDGTGDFGTVLRLDNDADYPSDFPYMLCVIRLNDEKQLYSLPHIHECRITHNEYNTSDMTDRQLGCCYEELDDGTTWDECLHRPELSHICFCYAFHTLYTDHPYSLADIIRINSFGADAKLIATRTTDQGGKRRKDIRANDCTEKDKEI